MTAEALFDRHAGNITRRLQRMVGSREVAEELTQETFLRLWRQAPSGLPAEQGAAWLYRTAGNLAVDELRRRRLRDSEVLRDSEIAALAGDEDEGLAVREALARLTPHQRLLVLLRFQAGLSHREIGDLLKTSAEAARKRVARARRAFAAAYRGTPRGGPLILLETRDDPAPYRAWLERAGAEVRIVRPGAIGPQVALADGFILGGSVIDVHPSLYRERPRVRLKTPDLSRDVRELRTMRAALEAGCPMVGVCRGPSAAQHRAWRQPLPGHRRGRGDPHAPLANPAPDRDQARHSPAADPRSQRHCLQRAPPGGAGDWPRVARDLPPRRLARRVGRAAR